MNALRKLLKRTPKPWHLPRTEIDKLAMLSFDELLVHAIKLQEQSNRIVRALVKLRQAIAEMTAAGE